MVEHGNFSGFGAPPGAPVEVFLSCSGASDDTILRGELAMHLAPLEAQGFVRVWHHDKLWGGDDTRRAAAERLDAARFVLLLVSARFLASNNCKLEVERAMARRGPSAPVIVPVLLSSAVWESAPFGHLEPLPSRVPVTMWSSRDEAWSAVVRGLRALLERHDLRSSWLPPPSSDPNSSLRSFLPKPAYADDWARALSEQLQQAHRRKERLKRAGQSTDGVTQEILDLKRKFRAAGQLKEGDVLGHDGRYLLMSKLGRGGFGLIWRARDEVSGDDVAVKVLRPDLAAEPIRLERFLRGARVMAELRHPSIVRVLDMPPDDNGWYYYAMELLKGGDLREAVLAKRLTQDQVFSIILSVGTALAEVHAARWVHRDVKPSNIVLTEDNIPKLTDFDLVGGPDTTGATTRAIGSPIFQAPELITRPHETDARTDVYSLGMTALFSLYGDDWPDDILLREHAPMLIERLQCSDAVKEVLLRAVDFHIDRRFDDVASFRDALERAVRGASEGPEITLDSIWETAGEGSAVISSPNPSDSSPGPIDPSKAKTGQYFVAPPRDSHTPLLRITDAYLLMTDGPPGAAIGARIMLRRNPTSIGREPSGDGGGIVLPHANISRAHARIELRGFSLVVIDEGSTNGTFVSARKTPDDKRKVVGAALLNHGAILTFSKEFAFKVLLMPHVGGEPHMQEFERLKVDASTGLASRRYLFSCLERAALNAHQEKERLSFLVLQLLKRPGDAGPPVDGLLTELARIVERQGIDGMIGRYDGRSIGVILKGKTADEAKALAEEVRGWHAPPSMIIRYGAADLLIDDRDPAAELRSRVLRALDIPHGEEGDDL